VTTSMEERTDASLVALARCGDKQAFCELIECYQAMAQILTMRLVGNVDIARETSQSAHTAICCRKKGRLRLPKLLQGWTFVI